MFSFPEIKNDTDGKIYYEEDGKVVWVTEVPDYVQDSVALAFNQIIARVVEKFNSAHSPTNTGSPKLCRSCIKIYACIKAGDNIGGCCEYESIAA